MSKTNRIFKFVCAIMAVLLISVVAVACNKTEKYTLKFVADGLDIPSITATAGSEITPPEDPSKEDFKFAGWYTNPDFEGDAVELPTVMPKANVTYYAKFVALGESGSVSIIYDVNTILASGSITPSYGEPGDSIKVKDGSAYQADGLLFIGWSVEQNGLISQFGSPEEGQYLAGDLLTLGDSDVTLYAQWAYEQEPANGHEKGKIYFYFNYVGKGNGAIILVRDGKPNKLGFVSPRNGTDDFYEFEFMFEDDEDYGTGSVFGRLYDDNTYVFNDGLAGSFIYYDYITKSYDLYIMTADGYGEAIVSQVIYDTVKTLYYGRYVYDEEYGDYAFYYIDPETKQPLLDSENQPMQSYMSIELGSVPGMENGQFIGSFTYLGFESGSYLLYDNGELLNYRLDLNGYGSAKLYYYDSYYDTTELLAEGEYYGTEDYESEYGEWIFVAYDNSDSFKFILNMIQDSVYGNVTVYIEYNEALNVALTGNDGSTLYLDGYGTAEYTAVGGIDYIGYFTANTDGTLLTFIPYVENPDGSYSAGGKMFFNVNWTEKTYEMNTTGYIVNDDGEDVTLVSYLGESKVIVIPDGVTIIADDVFNYLYLENNISIVSATIPASVKSIGARAFENLSTLLRAVFLSETPIEIDWSSENNPFRWASNSAFIIVVPEGYQEVYKEAWADSPYVNSIKGSVEVTLLPEFEIVDGVLIRYNVQPDAPDMLDLVMPNEATSIAANVFAGFENLRSIDLNNVTVIGDGAFEWCVNLESVIFTNVQTIGEAAFAGCEILGSLNDGIISLPSIVKIGDGAFQSCYALIHVVIGENIEEIGSYAFSETNMQIEHGSLYLELLGDNAPEMGEKVFSGNISTRIKVKSIDVVLSCFNEPTFAIYNKHLYVESGDEAGLYFDGTDRLELDGRAILLSTYLMMYSIDGEVITFYEFDEENVTYYTAVGTYKDDEINVVLGQINYTFKKYAGDATYVSEDGKYTLVCNPIDLDPESYDGFKGYATVKFNGQEVQLYVAGYNTKTISMFLDSDGNYYDFSLSIVGDTLIYEKNVADRRITVNADDGSSLTLHFTVNFTYVYGSLKIVVGHDDDGDIMMPDNSDYSTIATAVSDNVYTFTRIYLGKSYVITITVSQDQTTFTYSYVEQ